MRRFLIFMMLLFCMLHHAEVMHAQYYSWGADPASFRWRQMKSENYRVIYPDTAQIVGQRMRCYLDAVSSDISYGYLYPQMSIPFVVHPANMRSNGLVMWLPKRVEFISAPATESYSMPWVKQLVAHEYRHAVQYNNLNRGFVKALSYVIGQQSSTIGLLFMPLWMMEGDAVMTETAMSTFGRGLQPSFTMAYRAYGNVADEFRNIDTWFCGSYKHHIPDHYALGYLMCRYGYNRYGGVIGNDIAWLSVRRPYMIVSTSWMLKRLYGTSQPQLFDDTFRELTAHWQPLEEVDASTTPIAINEPTAYTEYAYPMPYGDKTLALKTDLDSPSAYVLIDSLGNEQRMRHTGSVSSRPALDSSGRIWWTEYKRSLLFDQKVGSEVCYMDSDRRIHRIPKSRNALYVTPIDSGKVAWVEYDYNGSYTIIHNGLAAERRATRLPLDKEVHGMAWDDKTEALYLLITDDRGMHIARLANDTLSTVTPPAYTTLSDLRAKDGRLYFGSIASGRDELHCYDLATEREMRLSTSKYGSFAPMPADSSSVLATTYDKRGYMPVRQRIDTVQEVIRAPHPPMLMLPRVKDWDVVNLDTVRFSREVTDSITRATPPKRFRRALHAFNIHSWAPLSYDPYSIVEQSRISFNLGATIMSQNILSNTEGFLTWGWNHAEGSVFKGTIRYKGLGVNLWVEGTYGGRQKLYTVYQLDSENGIMKPDAPKLGKYYSIGAGATLPMLIQHGYFTSQVTLSAGWNFSNGMVADVKKFKIEDGKITNFETVGYKEGVHLLQATVGYQNVARQAHRDFLPPWAVALSATYALNPATDAFGHLAVLYGKLYTPGFAKHHSLSLAVSYQTSIGGFKSPTVLSGLAFKSTKLLPRGFDSHDIENKNYIATSLNYQLPVWYPDGGWRGVIFFKRLRLNIGADYASYNKASLGKFKTLTTMESKNHFTSGREVTGGAIHAGSHIGQYDAMHDGELSLLTERRQRLISFGCDITTDFNLFTMPSAATMSATLSLYWRQAPHIASKNNKLYVSFGLGLPF